MRQCKPAVKSLLQHSARTGNSCPQQPYDGVQSQQDPRQTRRP